MAYLNSRTGERREVVTFKRGYQEMAELVGSSRYKTVQAWFNPQWEKQRRGGNITRFLSELETADANTYADLRTETMPRTYRVLLDEPLDASGSNKADANGSIRVDADGSNSQTRMEALVDASGSNMVDANGTALNTLKHSLNTQKNNTSSTQHDESGGGGACFLGTENPASAKQRASQSAARAAGSRRFRAELCRLDPVRGQPTGQAII